MSAHFTAVERPGGPHFFFHERVPRFRHNRNAARRFHDVERVPREPGIVDDGAAGLSVENPLGEKTDEVITLDKLPVFVEKEAPVEIAVPCHAEIRTGRDNRIGGVRAILEKERIRDSRGKRAVGIEVFTRDNEREVRYEFFENGPGAPVSRIRKNFQRFEQRNVHETENPLYIAVHHVGFGDRSPLRGFLGYVAGPDPALDVHDPRCLR